MEVHNPMQAKAKPKFKYWQEDDVWLGYLEEFPDYHTQGTNLEDLKDHLADLYQDLSTGKIPAVRRIDELDIP